jgi:hypothetical protein
MLILCFGFLNQTEATSLVFEQKQSIRMYSNGSVHAQSLINTFNTFGIKFDQVDSVSPDENNLYIIFDAFTINPNQLPRYYIAYQTRDLQAQSLDNDYVNILKNAVAVWDYSWKNIDAYRTLISHYYYLPENAEFADPGLLPCVLPLTVLDHYKHVLIDSNTIDTELSSHLPALFAYAYANNPGIIVEAGVAVGNSSRTFNRVAQLLDIKLIGMDISKEQAYVYQPLSNGILWIMSDIYFSSYYARSPFKDIPLKVIFIDTSHEYHHSLQEIAHFVPLLADGGMMMFHDANVTPLSVEGREGWWRVNNTFGVMLPSSPSNPRGVTPALRESFGINFDETRYQNFFFNKDGVEWHFVHYPFCNGLTVLKKINN